MSYNYRILNDHPRHFYPLAAGSFVDATGRANGVVLGTPTEAPPLVVGGGSALAMDGNNNFRFATDIFHLNSPAQPFTLEAWFKPVSISGPKGIVGHDGQDDGLYFDGERIVFATDHGTAGRAEAVWFPPHTDRALHLIGVHTDSRNELFVNGVRVASINLSPEQQATSYAIALSPGNLHVGHRPGSVIVDSVAVYAKALTSRQAKLHFLWGRDVPDFRDVISRREAHYWDFTDNSALIAYDFAFSTTDEWSQGLSASVLVENDQLAPLMVDGTSIEGTWMNGFILSSVAENLDGSKIWWDGDGDFSVSVSLNGGSTWTVAENGREVPGISEGFVSGTQALQVRVVFPAGQPEGTISKVRSLNLRLYLDRDVRSNLDRQVEFTGKVALAQEVAQPIEHNDSMGANIYAGYGLIQAGDTVRTLEMWINPSVLPGAPVYIYDTRPALASWLYWTGTGWSGEAGTRYLVNGVLTAPVDMLNKLVVGRWNQVVAILPADTTGAIYISARHSLDERLAARYGFIAGYPTALTDAEALAAYNAYLGIPGATVVEPTGLNVTDSATTTKLYAYSWSTVGSG